VPRPLVVGFSLLTFLLVFTRDAGGHPLHPRHRARSSAFGASTPSAARCGSSSCTFSSRSGGFRGVRQVPSRDLVGDRAACLVALGGLAITANFGLHRNDFQSGGRDPFFAKFPSSHHDWTWTFRGPLPGLPNVYSYLVTRRAGCVPPLRPWGLRARRPSLPHVNEEALRERTPKLAAAEGLSLERLAVRGDDARARVEGAPPPVIPAAARAPARRFSPGRNGARQTTRSRNANRTRAGSCVPLGDATVPPCREALLD
jgi:hypothetical protein